MVRVCEQQKVKTMDCLKDLGRIMAAIILLLPLTLVFNDNGNIIPNIIGLAYLAAVARFRHMAAYLEKLCGRFAKIIRRKVDT